MLATEAFAPEPTAGSFRGNRTAGSAPARGTGARLVAGLGFGAAVVCRVTGVGGVVAFVAGGIVAVVVALVGAEVTGVVADDADGRVVPAVESG